MKPDFHGLDRSASTTVVGPLGGSAPEGSRKSEARRLTVVAVGLAAVVLSTGCPSGWPSGGSGSSATPSSSGREKGAREAADAIAAGTLKLREYPPLVYPPGHQEYVELLRERCGVGYEVPRLPPGVAKADFIQEVRGWNEAVKAKVKQKHGAGIFEQLHEEARKRWQEKVNPGGKR